MLKRPTIYIVGLCLLYVAVRLWRLTDACLWFDEIFGVHAAEHSWGGMLWFVAQDLIHPPLFYGLLKGWIAVGGESLLWLRLFSVFFAVLALVPFINLCRELKLKTSATILALALFAVNGSLIKYAQEVRMYSLLLFLSVLSIWLFARFFYRGKNIWILTLVNILLVYTHYFGWLVVLSEIVVIAVFQRVKIRHVLIMAAIAAVAFVPWIIAIIRAAGAGSEISQNIGWIERPGFGAILDLVFDLFEPFYFQASSIEPATKLWISLPIVLVFVIAKSLYLANRQSEDRERALQLSILIGVPVGCAVFVSWLSPYSVWGSRHLIAIFAPIIILFAINLTEISSRILQSVLISAVALLAITAGVQFARTPPAEQIWCAWDPLSKEFILAQHFSPQPKRLYAFEDLVAYHLWFGIRKNGGGEVRLVKGIDGVPNDPAYFLPRGFEEIGISSLDQIDDAEIWIAFRQATKELPPGIGFIKELPFEVPVMNLGNRNYVVEDVRKREVGLYTAYLIRMQKYPETK